MLCALRCSPAARWSAWPPEAPRPLATRSPSSPAARIPISGPWEQAAADAKRDFNIGAVDFKVPSDWKLNLQTELLESLMTQGYNGFGIFPGDAVGINSTVEELAANKAPSIALAGCAQDPTKVAFCFGTDVFNSAYLGTQALIKAMGGKGKIVHLAGLLIDPNTKLRMEAVEKAVKETNGAVTFVQHITDTDAQEAADQKINALLGAQKDQIDGMVATGYIPSVVASKSLRALGDKRIKFVGIDDKIVLDGIKDGSVAGTMAQKPYGQGYVARLCARPADQRDLHRQARRPVHQDAADRALRSIPGTLLISAANLDTYKNDLKKITTDLQTNFKPKYLNCK